MFGIVTPNTSRNLFIFQHLDPDLIQVPFLQGQLLQTDGAGAVSGLTMLETRWFGELGVSLGRF